MFSYAAIIILLSIFCSWLVAQLSKSKKNMTLRDLFTLSGGVLSSHSASVAALATGIFLYDGISLLFVVSLLFAAIVIKDAMAVRYAVGHNAEVLKKSLPKKEQKQVLIIKGHTAKQVFWGSMLGVFCSLLFYIFTLMILF